MDDYFFEEGGLDKEQWKAYAKVIGYTGDNGWRIMLNYYFKDRLISEWDAIFYNDIAPILFEGIYNKIGLERIGLGNLHFAGIDFSAEKRYKGGDTIARINLRGNGSNIKRNQIERLKITFANTGNLNSNLVTLTIRNVTIRFSTSHYNGTLYNGFIGDDLIDGTEIYTPENANEKRNPKMEDRYLADKLIVRLNSNLEHYNKALWRNLVVERRFMLLDGFIIETYDDFGQPADFRSLASIVKNEMIGIAGNALVMPVAPGYKIDRTYVIVPTIEGPVEELELFEHYKPLTPIPPYRISFPTIGGVYAEAIQGACDAWEKGKREHLAGLG